MGRAERPTARGIYTGQYDRAGMAEVVEVQEGVSVPVAQERKDEKRGRIRGICD